MILFATLLAAAAQPNCSSPVVIAGDVLKIDHEAVTRSRRVNWSEPCADVSNLEDARVPAPIDAVNIVNSDAVRFKMDCSRQDFKAAADRDALFAIQPTDFSVSGEIVKLIPQEKCSGPELKPEWKVSCAARELNTFARRIESAIKAARHLETQARRGNEFTDPGWTLANTKQVQDSLDSLTNYALNEQEIDAIASEYSAYPREVVEPIAQKIRLAVEQTPAIEEGLRNLTRAIDHISKTTIDKPNCSAADGERLQVSVTRILPLPPEPTLGSFTRTFVVKVPKPDGAQPPVVPPPGVVQPPPTPPPPPMTVNVNACCEKRKLPLIFSATVLYAHGSHDDAFTATPAPAINNTFVVQESGSRDTSLRAALTIGYPLPWWSLSADLSVVPASSIPVVALGASHRIVNDVLRLGAGLAFTREKRLSGLVVGQFVGTPNITTSESYKSRPYVALSVDLDALLRR
jgi:hypothetical protein